MPNRTAVVGDTVQYRTAAGDTRNIYVTGAQLAAPSNTLYTVTPQITGGTLANGTYSYRLSVTVDGVESAASTAKTAVVTGPTGSVDVDATALLAAYPTATAIKIYGRVAASELLIATIVPPTVLYTDDGSVTPAGTVPTYLATVRAADPGTNRVITDVPKATTVKATGSYFKR